jgi:hypothetical protein
MAGAGRAGTRRRLREAASDLSPVRIRRQIPGADRLEGFVLAVGERWVLLSNLSNGVRLDGFVAVRIDDIASVRTPASAGFMRSALEWRGQWPPPTDGPELNLSSDAGLITSAMAASPLVTLHIEYERPDVCFIGKPIRITAKRVDLQEVTPEATWENGGHTFGFKEISRVEIGGDYEQALHAVAGPAPPLKTS